MRSGTKEENSAGPSAAELAFDSTTTTNTTTAPTYCRTLLFFSVPLRSVVQEDGHESSCRYPVVPSPLPLSALPGQIPSPSFFPLSSATPLPSSHQDAPLTTTKRDRLDP